MQNHGFKVGMALNFGPYLMSFLTLDLMFMVCALQFIYISMVTCFCIISQTGFEAKQHSQLSMLMLSRILMAF
jgi:hypothetical protein